jgi:hypothetical protein
MYDKRELHPGNYPCDSELIERPTMQGSRPSDNGVRDSIVERYVAEQYVTLVWRLDDGTPTVA